MPPIKSSADNFAALRQQVIGIENDYQELKGVVVGLDRKMDAGFQAINTKLDARSATPWVAIGVMQASAFTIFGLVGWLAYTPILTSISKLESRIERDADKSYDRDSRITERLRIVEGKMQFYEGVLRPLTK